MKFCEFCGMKLEDNADVCDNCGTRILEPTPVMKPKSTPQNGQPAVQKQEEYSYIKNYNRTSNGDNNINNASQNGEYSYIKNYDPSKVKKSGTGINWIFNFILIVMFIFPFLVFHSDPLVKISGNTRNYDEEYFSIGLNYEALMETKDFADKYLDDEDVDFGYGYDHEIMIYFDKVFGIDSLFEEVRDDVEILNFLFIMSALIVFICIWIPRSRSGGWILMISSVVNLIFIISSKAQWAEQLSKFDLAINNGDGLIIFIIFQVLMIIMGMIKLFITDSLIKTRGRHYKGKAR